MTKQREDICDMMIKLDQDWYPQVTPWHNCRSGINKKISKDQVNSQFRVNQQIKDSVDSSKVLGNWETSFFYNFLFNYILFYSQVETLSLIDEKYPYEKTKVCGLIFIAFLSTIFLGYFLYLGIKLI